MFQNNHRKLVDREHDARDSICPRLYPDISVLYAIRDCDMESHPIFNSGELQVLGSRMGCIHIRCTPRSLYAF